MTDPREPLAAPGDAPVREPEADPALSAPESSPASALAARPVIGAAPGETPPEPPAEDDFDEEEGTDPSLPVPRGEQARAIIEALLFSATTPLSEKRLSHLLNGLDLPSVRESIERLRHEYEAPGRGVTIREVAGGYQLATRPELADWMYRLHRHRKKTGLTPATLETLAIIAYKQPIVRAEIEAIRGVDCGGVIRQLQDVGMVEVVGRKETPGRPPLYGTTDLFLKTFGLRRLDDLPSLEELQSLLAAGERPLEGQAELFQAEEPPSGASPAAPAGPPAVS